MFVFILHVSCRAAESRDWTALQAQNNMWAPACVCRNRVHVDLPQTHLVRVVGGSIFPAATTAAAAAVTVLHAAFGRFGRFLFTHRRKVEATFNRKTKRQSFLPSLNRWLIQVTSTRFITFTYRTTLSLCCIQIRERRSGRVWTGPQSFHMLTLSVLSWSLGRGQRTALSQTHGQETNQHRCQVRPAWTRQLLTLNRLKLVVTNCPTAHERSAATTGTRRDRGLTPPPQSDLNSQAGNTCWTIQR